MSRLKIDLIFPCGFEIHKEVCTGFFTEYQGGNWDIDGCPLHGKKCKKVKL